MFEGCQGGRGGDANELSGTQENRDAASTFKSDLQYLRLILPTAGAQAARLRQASNEDEDNSEAQHGECLLEQPLS